MKDFYVPLSHSVAKTIEEMIFLQKRFTPGDRIPSEMELAAELGVSRTSIREAVRALIARDILEIRRGKGTFVSLVPTSGDGFLSHARLEDQRALARNMFEFRLILEPETVRLATLRATEEDLDAMEAHERSCADSFESDSGAFDRSDAQFHIAIARATRNEVITRLVPFLQHSVAEARRTSRYIYKDGEDPVARNAVVTHREIMRYMRLRDAEGASISMRYHIKRAMADLHL